MTDWHGILERIQADPRYQAGILYGEPRPGHSEGTIQAHISELSLNLALLGQDIHLPFERHRQLLILIHVHDTFKIAALPKCSISDPGSHASLARAFLAEFCDDLDMLRIVQYHDLGHALYRKWKDTGRTDRARLIAALDDIVDIDLYLMFCILDACTDSKGRESIRWWVNLVRREYPRTIVTADDILPEKTHA